MSKESYLAYKFDSKVDRVHIAIVVAVLALFIESIISIRTLTLGLDNIVISLMVVILSMVPLSLRDKLTHYEDNLLLSIAPAVYLGAENYSDLSKIALFVGLLLACSIPPKTRKVQEVIYEIFSIYVAFIFAEIFRQITMLALTGGLERYVGGIYIGVAILVYGLIKPRFIARMKKYGASGVFKNYWSVNFAYLMSSMAVALVSISILEVNFNLFTYGWIFLIPIFVGLLYMKFIRDRNSLYITLLNFNSLLGDEEKKTKEAMIAGETSMGIAYELGLEDEDLDTTALAVLTHDLGKAGMDEYSVEHILETISSAKGEPLHAERGFEILRIIPGFEKVAEVVRKHHELSSTVSITRATRKKGAMPPKILNVAVSFSELLTSGGEIITERETFKLLKKESGWNYSPKVLRALKNFLEKRGITRLK